MLADIQTCQLTTRTIAQREADQSKASNCSDAFSNSDCPERTVSLPTEFERLFGRNAIEPPLVRKLLVVGECQPQENPHARRRSRPSLRFSAFAPTFADVFLALPLPLPEAFAGLWALCGLRRRPFALQRRIPRARISAATCLRGEMLASSHPLCVLPVAPLLRLCRNRKSEWIEPYILYSGLGQMCQARHRPVEGRMRNGFVAVRMTRHLARGRCGVSLTAARIASPCPKESTMDKQSFLRYVDHFNNKRYEDVMGFYDPDVSIEYPTMLANPQAPPITRQGPRRIPRTIRRSAPAAAARRSRSAIFSSTPTGSPRKCTASFISSGIIRISPAAR